MDTASYHKPDSSIGHVAIQIAATIPVADHTFIETILPLGIIYPLGNPTIGAHHVARVGDPLWITAGGSIGIPLVEDDDFRGQAIPRGLWSMHSYQEDILPLQAQFGIEYHASIVELRGHLEPSLWAPLGNNDVHGAFYHSLELQLGHSIGGGFRVQGVAVGNGTRKRSNGRLGDGDDYYQLSFSPFFVVHRELGFLRLGLMLPVDEKLGPAFEESWGFLFATGLNID